MKEHEINKREVFLEEGDGRVKIYFVDGEFDSARIHLGEICAGGVIHVHDRKELSELCDVVYRAHEILGE